MTPLQRAAVLMAQFIAAAHAGAVQGTVIEDHSGDPVASAEIKLAKTGTRNAIAELESDRRGHFDLPPLTPGEYTLDISKPNYRGSRQRFAVANDVPPAQYLSVRLIRHAAISGQVIDRQGHPVHDAHVLALPIGAQGRTPVRAPERVGEDGTYRIHDLAPGRYQLAVSYGASTIAVGSTGSASVHSGLGSGVLFYPDNTHPRTFTISGGEEIPNIDFTLAPASISNVSGKVEAPKSEGVFWLTLVSASHPEISVATAVSDADGSFHFEGVPAGSYSLLASGPSQARSFGGGEPGPAPLFARVPIYIGGQDVEGLTVPLQSGRPAKFVLRGGAECPATAHLALTPVEDWGSRLETGTEIELDKEKELERLAPGPYRVTLDMAGDKCYGPSDLILDTRSRTIEIRMTPAGSIRGRLTGTHKPRDFNVILLDAGSYDGPVSQRTALPDAESRVHFDGLRPGRYLISAQPLTGAKAHMMEIEIRGGAPNDVQLAASDSDVRK